MSKNGGGVDIRNILELENLMCIRILYICFYGLTGFIIRQGCEK